MSLNSLQYFIFLPIVFAVFYLSTDRYRWVVLLVASYLFYASLKAPQLLFALAFVTVISFSCGIRLGRTEGEGRRKLIFWLGIACCVLILAVMKYLPPLLRLGIADYPPNWLSFIGVSYFTFQAISYLADIYMEVQDPEQHLGYYALSLVFFPKLLQGPIERAGNLLPQLKKAYEFDYEAMRSGMLLFTWGLFKKVVVADRLALYANPVYNDVQAYTGVPLIIATYAYALQIYFDFAGYTDMARGTARMFGISLTENFNSPYLATSIADFWRRWHISFSRWILDYIFKPLQMAWRDHGQAGMALALLVTFLISGIWHGGSWGFVIWGLLHGLYLAASIYYRPYQKRLHKYLGIEKSRWLTMWQVFVTFNLVSFTWIFFRAESLGDALYILKNIVNFYGNYVTARELGFTYFTRTNILMGRTDFEFITICIILIAIYYFRNIKDNMIFIRPTIIRWFIYYCLFLTIYILGLSGSQFVYFKF